MKKMKFILLMLSAIICITTTSCTENYSKGERIGMITKFSRSGILWNSWEGELHVTQTGMNSTMNDFQFSIDNDHEDQNIINTIDSAAEHGWKIKLVYHETFGKNWFQNRGETNDFITDVQVLDKNPLGDMFKKNGSDSTNVFNSPCGGGHIIDTVYLVIYKQKN